MCLVCRKQDLKNLAARLRHLRLSLPFDTTAESWLNQQAIYDLWKAEQQRGELNVKRLVGVAIISNGKLLRH